VLKRGVAAKSSSDRRQGSRAVTQYAPETLASTGRRGYDNQEEQNRSSVAAEVAIDWMACELIEAVPGNGATRESVIKVLVEQHLFAKS
jgi:hypothetical protein